MHKLISKLTAFITLFLFSLSGVSLAAETDQPNEETVVMNNDRLATLIHRIDKKAKGEKGYWQFQIQKHTVTVLTNEKADRMRIIIPIIESDKLEQQDMLRIMQANFDTALDARYAVAKQILWIAYIHPLATLSDDEFILGLAQTANLVNTFGTSYSSGLLSFNGGDSRAIQEKQLIQELLKKGLSI